jgi:hypothetical protein
MNEQRIRDVLRQATDTAEILIGDDVLGEAPRLVRPRLATGTP